MKITKKLIFWHFSKQWQFCWIWRFLISWSHNEFFIGFYNKDQERPLWSWEKKHD